MEQEGCIQKLEMVAEGIIIMLKDALSAARLLAMINIIQNLGLLAHTNRRLMDKKFGLSETEYELMEFFWDNPGEKSFKEILEYFNNVKGKNWKKQTLSTFLTILQNRGYLQADMSKRKYPIHPLASAKNMSPLGSESFVKTFLVIP